MSNLTLSSSQTNSLPVKWQKRYLLKRIGEDDIEISLEARNEVLRALSSGVKFVQLGEYTLMLNSIKSIDPKWGDDNIPPAPQIRTERIGWDDTRGVFLEQNNPADVAEYELWRSFFGSTQLGDGRGKK